MFCCTLRYFGFYECKNHDSKCGHGSVSTMEYKMLDHKFG